MSYQFIDAGNGKRLERFGDALLIRPASGALWKPSIGEWKNADGEFFRQPENRWVFKKSLPKEWVVTIEGIQFLVKPTDFGHLGVFPEHQILWRKIVPLLKKRKDPTVLNLFAYSGGATLVAARAGAKVCHLDASKGMVSWARENAKLNSLDHKPIRWIVDDVFKFLKREKKRGATYDGIIMDPPTFGRGSQGQVFKIESDVNELIDLCYDLLSDNPLFVIFSTHTPGITPLVLKNLIEEKRGYGQIEKGELFLGTKKPLPLGSYAKWYNE